MHGTTTPLPQELLRISAFSDGSTGGNPAGVLIAESHPADSEMQRIANVVGFSETAFAAPERGGSGPSWRVRYFSPESEVPFCGHATIALGAALAQKYGDGIFSLTLNNAQITVEGKASGESLYAALQSPPTRSKAAPPSLIDEVLSLFNYKQSDLDPRIPPALIHGGADHLVIALKNSEALSRMHYDLNAGRALMNRERLVTIVFAYAETPRLFHTRNPFASGGVYEDPATGAWSAAFAGYLRDLKWPHGGRLEFIQGEDMGMRSRIWAELTDEIGSSIRVSGAARVLT